MKKSYSSPRMILFWACSMLSKISFMASLMSPATAFEGTLRRAFTLAKRISFNPRRIISGEYQGHFEAHHCWQE